MAGSDDISKCPKCSAEIGTFFINEEEAIAVCINPKCSYPFGEEGNIDMIPNSLAEEKIKQRSKAINERISHFSMESKQPIKIITEKSIVPENHEESIFDNCSGAPDFDIEAFLASIPSTNDVDEAVKLIDIVREIEDMSKF